jgi:hypothetical protein
MVCILKKYNFLIKRWQECQKHRPRIKYEKNDIGDYPGMFVG